MSGTLLHLMRHGAPELTGRLLGHADWPATDAGIAACVARAHTLEVEVISSSDLTRARQAATAIAAQRGIAPRTDPRWRELDFGAWDGADPATLDQSSLACFHADPDACPPPGGERWSALVARVGEAIAALPRRPTLVVTHGGAMRAALAALCGFDQRQIWTVDLPYAACLTLRLWPGDRPWAQLVGLVT
ncbi:histidine phosphatase family protein [Sphingobium cupriresistens]|uniref:Phosphoglycerate mutase n=1 Tax=Sphingobium cupriresistens LL01 TaxID=1420583 RepID=A0A0J7XM45_9SPHN|nr:histidine phosphatase family protein [Sphingobium cupriresistens]KMS52173.1 phosphoglycerate mutase [Sphingobium cupriresistens LL01]